MALYNQSNTQQGRVVKSSSTSLQGFEGLGVVLVNNGGYGSVALPTNVNQRPYGVITDGSVTDIEVLQQQGLDWGPAGCYGVQVLPQSPDRNTRFYLYGTCNPGDLLVWAPIGTVVSILLPQNFTSTGTNVTLTVTTGMVQSLATAGAGTFGVIGQSEEAGTQGQLVLVRPYVGLQVTQ
jgi:hypothetical protein